MERVMTRVKTFQRAGMDPGFFEISNNFQLATFNLCRMNETQRQRLASYMAHNVAGFAQDSYNPPKISVKKFPWGQSNPTFLIEGNGKTDHSDFSQKF